MSTGNDRHGSDSIAGALAEIRRKGVKLWSEGGKLHYRAPRGALSPEDKKWLGTLGPQIASLLESSVSLLAAEPRLEPRQPSDRVPLTFSQLAHWHTNRLADLPTRRSVTSATRLRGKLDVPLLRSSLAEMIRRHEALRTRIVVVNGIPEQHITESSATELDFQDLTRACGSDRAARLERLIHELILEPIDVTRDPLFAARLVKLADDEHVLIAAMEHIISDGYSRNILLRDLFATYLQASHICATSLPAVAIQFADFAVWQSKAHQWWLDRHGTYWREHLAGAQRLRFPEDGARPEARESAWRRVALRIDSGLRKELRQWCRLKQTTPVIAVFTVFVAAVLRWCQAAEGVIAYQTDGRSSALVENTIGYFAAALNLRVQLRPEDGFTDLLERVTREYCAAHEHADQSFIDAQIPPPAFIGNPGFNWVPEALLGALPTNDGVVQSIEFTQVPFTYPMPTSFPADSDPSLLLFDKGDEIVGSVSFPLSRFSTAAMEAFARDLLVFVKTLIRNPAQRIRDVPLSRTASDSQDSAAPAA